MTQLHESGETAYHDQVQVLRISSLGPLTDIKLEPGSKDNQRLYVINEGSFALALSTESALTHDGKPCDLPRLGAVRFFWDAASSRWIKDY